MASLADKVGYFFEVGYSSKTNSKLTNYDDSSTPTSSTWTSGDDDVKITFAGFAFRIGLAIKI